MLGVVKRRSLNLRVASSMAHEVVIGAVAVQIITRCVPVQQTDAEIYSLGSTSKY